MIRRYSAVVKVKTTTSASGAVTLTEAGQCMGSSSETKTVT
jgi:hypothetical protein